MNFEIKKINGEIVVPVKTGTIKLCNVDDFQNICYIQKEMIKGLSDKNFCLPIADKRIKEILGDPQSGYFFGAFLDEELIGWKFLSFNQKYINLLKNNMPKIEGKCAALDGTAILPKYRGNGLQKLLIGASENLAKELGVKHVVAEVTEGNCVSLNNLLEIGYTVQGDFKRSKDFKVHVLQKTLSGKLKSFANNSKKNHGLVAPKLLQKTN